MSTVELVILGGVGWALLIYLVIKFCCTPWEQWIEEMERDTKARRAALASAPPLLSRRSSNGTAGATNEQTRALRLVANAEHAHRVTAAHASGERDGIADPSRSGTVVPLRPRGGATVLLLDPQRETSRSVQAPARPKHRGL